MQPDAVGVLAFLLILASGVLWFRAAGRVRLPENRSVYLAVWLGGVGLGGVALAQESGWVGWVSAVLAIIGGAFFLFTVAISRQKAAADAISVGAMLPDFTALDENGQAFEASSLSGHPVLIKFFRGHW